MKQLIIALCLVSFACASPLHPKAMALQSNNCYTVKNHFVTFSNSPLCQKILNTPKDKF